jgi:hypothetical protein
MAMAYTQGITGISGGASTSSVTVKQAAQPQGNGTMKYVLNGNGMPTNKKLYLIHVQDASLAPESAFDSKDEALAYASKLFENYKGQKPVAIYELTDIAIPVVPKVEFTTVK